MTKEPMHVYVFDSADLPMRNVDVEHTPGVHSLDDECLGFNDEALRADIEDRKRKFNPANGQFDGRLLSLNDFDANGKRTLHVGDVMYSTYQALKSRFEKTPGQEHSLTRTVCLIAFLETRDNAFVFGHRNSAHMGGKYLPPAGFSDHLPGSRVAKYYFEELSVEEIEEETGTHIDASKMRYAGLTSGDDSRNTTVISLSPTLHSVSDVERIFNVNNAKIVESKGRIEHEHLLYVPSDLESVARFLSGKFTGVLNPVLGIEFKDGVCVRGPELIKGKPYEQIGNGVSGLLAIMKSRVSSTDYQGLVEVVQKAGVARVDHVSLSEKIKFVAYR